MKDLVPNICFSALLILSPMAWGKDKTPDAGITSMDAKTLTNHAAATVASLHDSMLDPASFVLDGVFVSKPNRQGQISLCYAFRSHNTLGGYAEGRATEGGLNAHGGLEMVPVSEDGAWLGYDTGWIAPCKAKNIDREITADVSPLAEARYKKTK